MNKATIHERVHAAIRPQLDRADELLDHYTEGLPPNLWQPMALRLALSTGVWKAATTLSTQDSSHHDTAS